MLVSILLAENLSHDTQHIMGTGPKSKPKSKAKEQGADQKYPQFFIYDNYYMHFVVQCYMNDIQLPYRAPIMPFYFNVSLPPRWKRTSLGKCWICLRLTIFHIHNRWLNESVGRTREKALIKWGRGGGGGVTKDRCA